MSNDKIEQAIKLLIDVNREEPLSNQYGEMQDVFAMIEACWCEETSYYHLDRDNLSEMTLVELHFDFRNGYYQCATTTALLHEIYGGEVVSGDVDGRKHYWNRINGVDVDITRRQFEAGTRIDNIKVINPNDLVTDEWMSERYQNLRGKFDIEVKKKAIYG